MKVLLTVAWIVAIINATVPSYWLVVHPRARRWAARGGRRLTSIGPVWMLLWIIVGAITWPWRFVVLYETKWTWFLAAVLIASGFVIYGFGRRNFSLSQILGRAELEPDKHEQRMVATGIRAHIRHPYYLGHLLELAAWTIGSGLVVCYAMLAFGILTGILMIRAEERELSERFGAAYDQYRQRTAAMFPGIW